MREWSSGMRVEGEIDVYIFMRMFTFLYERMMMMVLLGRRLCILLFDFDLLYIT